MRKRWKTTVRAGSIVEPKDGSYGLLLKSLEGKHVSLSVAEWKPYSTDRQFAYYYGVILKLIADKTGYTRDELDNILKNKFMYEYVKIGDSLERRLLSKKEVTTAKFTEFINDIICWASKLDIAFPDPNEVSLDDM